MAEVENNEPTEEPIQKRVGALILTGFLNLTNCISRLNWMMRTNYLSQIMKKLNKTMGRTFMMISCKVALRNW